MRVQAPPPLLKKNFVLCVELYTSHLTFTVVKQTNPNAMRIEANPQHVAHYTFYAWYLHDVAHDKWHELPSMLTAKSTHAYQLEQAIKGLGYALYLRRYAEYSGYTGYAKVEAGRLPRYFNSGYKVPARCLRTVDNLTKQANAVGCK